MCTGLVFKGYHKRKTMPTIFSKLNALPKLVDVTDERQRSAIREMERQPLHYAFYVGAGGVYDWSNRVIKDLRNKLDMVPHFLIAKLLVPELHDKVKKSFWCRGALQRPLSYADERCAAMPAEETDPAVLERKRRKKGLLDRPEPKTTSIVSNAIRHIWDSGRGLFHTDNGAIGKPECYFGAFFISKPNGLLRVIMDCRWTNILVKSSEAKFQFFQFEALRQVIDNLSLHRRWYAVNLDLRHWFHQIRLPDRYKKRLGFRMMDQHETNFFLFPRVCPMGWTMSPIIGQCCTWALLMVTKNNEQHDKEKFDLPHPLELSKHTSPFTWIPLARGGGIFVLLDNVLIVTPEKEVAENWLQHIVDNANEFHAVIKCESNAKIATDAPAPSPLNDINALRKECLFELTPNNNQHFTFTGVEWYHSSHLVRLKHPGDDLDVPNIREAGKKPNYDPETKLWSGTHTELSRVVGRLGWHRRVHDIRFYDREDESMAIRSAYASICPPPGFGWGDELTLSPEVTAGVCSAWKFRKSQAPAPAEPLCAEFVKTVWVVGDAATNEQEVDGEKLNPQYAVISINPETKTPFGEIVVKDFPKDFEIALGELLVILESVEMHSEEYDLIVLATDSMTAKYWVENRNAHNLIALTIIGHIEELLRKNKCRLYLTYVNTLSNAADLSSRRKKENAEILPALLKETLVVLTNAAVEAKGMWSLNGGIIGGVSEIRQRESDS